MSDFKTVFTDLTSGARYSINDFGIEEDRTIATAVVISLFTDKRDTSAVPEDARGFWADDEIGSLRWTLSREKQTPDVVNRLIRYDTDALRWLMPAGLARAVNVTAEFIARGVLKENVDITLTDGSAARFLIEETNNAL